MSTWFDVHWIDVLSVATGIAYAFHVRRRAADTRPIISKNTALDFVGGFSLAPLALLFVGAFSETVLAALTRANAGTLAAASIIAIFSILESPEPR